VQLQALLKYPQHFLQLPRAGQLSSSRQDLSISTNYAHVSPSAVCKRTTPRGVRSVLRSISAVPSVECHTDKILRRLENRWMSKDSPSILATMSAWKLHKVSQDGLPTLPGKLHDLLKGQIRFQVFVADEAQLFSLSRPHLSTRTTLKVR